MWHFTASLITERRRGHSSKEVLDFNKSRTKFVILFKNSKKKGKTPSLCASNQTLKSDQFKNIDCPESVLGYLYTKYYIKHNHLGLVNGAEPTTVLMRSRSQA